MYRLGQVSESCPFSGLKLRGRTLISTAPARKETQIILSWQYFRSVLQFFLFQLSASLPCLDLYVFQQNNWVKQGHTIFQSSQMQSIHRVPPIAISITFLFLQLSESWEGELMEKIIFVSPQTLEMCLSIWQQNLTTGTICSLCYTGPSKSSFFHLSWISEEWGTVSYFCSSHDDLLHELLHWLWLHRKQHSAKLKMRLYGLIRTALFSCGFFKIKECLSNKIFWCCAHSEA